MQLRFTKLQGLGNDFVVIDGVRQSIHLTLEQIRYLADRHYGIGCDQVLLVGAARSPDEDFFYRIFNPNGSEVGQCGNGVRCLTRFVHEQGLTHKPILRIATSHSMMLTEVVADGFIRVNMGEPIFAEAKIPVASPLQQQMLELTILQQTYWFSVLSMGNPHAVTWVEDIEFAPVQEIGSIVTQHVLFPEQTNVGFMQWLNEAHIRLRVYERHAGETLACGSGACAAVVAGILQQKLQAKVKVDLPGGELIIEWAGLGHPVWMSGPAVSVFDGHISLS